MYIEVVYNQKIVFTYTAVAGLKIQHRVQKNVAEHFKFLHLQVNLVTSVNLSATMYRTLQDLS